MNVNATLANSLCRPPDQTTAAEQRELLRARELAARKTSARPACEVAVIAVREPDLQRRFTAKLSRHLVRSLLACLLSLSLSPRTSTQGTNVAPSGSSWRFSLAMSVSGFTHPCVKVEARGRTDRSKTTPPNWRGMRARVISLPALKADKSKARDDPLGGGRSFRAERLGSADRSHLRAATMLPGSSTRPLHTYYTGPAGC